MPTIFALSSGRPPAGVAVIRISGPAALAAAARLTGRPPAIGRPRLTRLTDPHSGDLLDRVLVLAFAAPHSFTGEDVIELHVHGGRAVIEAVLAALARCDGLRPAEPGEFTRRAFENGRFDLTAVEGLADLIAAETEAQRRQALAQAGGVLARRLDDWRGRLLKAQALAEAAIDFSDEADVATDSLAAARAMAAALEAEIQAALADGHRGEIVREGYRVVLAGPPNVGKSSLLNALARRDVAIVSPEPGTTRDAIEVRLDLEGLPVVVTDTAGLREGGGAVEREGMWRTMARAREADLVLWLIDCVEPEPAVPPELATGAAPVLPLLTKTDLLCQVRPVPGVSRETLRVSARTGRGLPELIGWLAARARASAGGAEAALVTRLRHRQGLQACVAALADVQAGAEAEIELRAEDLRRAAAALGRVAGRLDVEDVLGAIFEEFCIGK